MLVKFASAEAQVLGFKGSAKAKLRTASLSKFGEYSDYRTDDDYLYVRVRAISSRVNKNHDGWPAEELQKSWRTFIGKPIFVDHHNSEPSKARGVVVDAALHVDDDFEKASSLDPYYATAPDNHKPPTWIELLLEVDAKTFPKLAKAIIEGDIDGVSMGCNVERSKCSVCSNWARSPEEYCKHIVSKGAYFDHKQKDGTKVSKKSYEDCYDIGFFEISFVFDPADETALVRDLKTARTSSVKKDVYHEAGLFDGDPGGTYGDPRNIEMKGYPAEQMLPPEAMQQQNMAPGQQVPGPSDAQLDLINLMGGDQALAGQVATAFSQALANRNDPLSAAHSVGQMLLRRGFDNGTVSQILDELVRGAEVPTVDQSRFDEMPFGLDNSLPHVMHNNPLYSKTADRNPLPQSEQVTMPEKVDTLRKEQLCPICGSDMEDGVCEVCNYEEPPEGFDNPDLDKAKEREEQQDQQQPIAPDAPPNPLETPGGAAGPAAPPPTSAPQMPMAASYKSTNSNGVTTDMGTWKVVTKTHTASGDNSGGRINTQERPILPAPRQNSDKPSGARVVKDSLAPVESNDKENTRMDQNHKVADGVGATPAGEGVSADKRVDPTGVGAVDNNPEGDTQHVNVEKEVSITGTPTDTWHGNEGDSLGQHEPVTNDVGSGGMSAPIGQPVSNTHTADGAWGHPGEGSGKEFPDHEPNRIDVQAPLTEEIGDHTMTWGPDDFHITDPVTGELGSGGMDAPIGEAFPTEALSPKADDSLKRSNSLRSHIFRAMKLAETEVELGMTPTNDKWKRAAELEEQTPVQLDAVEGTLARVKTAGLAKTPAPVVKKAHALPSFQTPVTQTEAPSSGDEQLFIR